MTQIGAQLGYLLMATESVKPQKQKHVIILGAGASCTSGYPLRVPVCPAHGSSRTR